MTFSWHSWQCQPHSRPHDASCVAVGGPYTISGEASKSLHLIPVVSRLMKAVLSFLFLFEKEGLILSLLK